MRNQPTPVVDMNDVERVVAREYPPDLAAEIHGRIGALEVREKARVVLACLKVAKREYGRLRRALADAPGYWRELLSEAEYPLATKRWSRMKQLSEQERSSIYLRDWSQYVAWLGRAAAATPAQHER
jgi:hypothetical protein